MPVESAVKLIVFIYLLWWWNLMICVQTSQVHIEGWLSAQRHTNNSSNAAMDTIISVYPPAQSCCSSYELRWCIASTIWHWIGKIILGPWLSRQCTFDFSADGPWKQYIYYHPWFSSSLVRKQLIWVQSYANASIFGFRQCLIQSCHSAILSGFSVLWNRLNILLDQLYPWIIASVL